MNTKRPADPPLTLARRRRNMVVSIGIAAVALAICVTSIVMFDGAAAILSCLLGWAMLAIAIEDAQHFIIPDYLSLPAIPIGLMATGVLSADVVAYQAILQHLFAAVIAAGALLAVRELYSRLRGFEGLGLGDVKLAAVAGAWTGLTGFSIVLLLACVSALIVLAVVHFTMGKTVTRRTALPFGAFLAPAIWLTWTAMRLAS